MQSVSEGLQRAVEKLTEDMFAMRTEMKEIYEENQRLRGRRFRSPLGGRCNCTCGEWGCQLRSSREERRGQSPEAGQFPRQRGFQPRSNRPDAAGVPSTSRLPGARSPSPSWRPRREEEPRRRGVHFLPRQRDNNYQGNDQ